MNENGWHIMLQANGVADGGNILADKKILLNHNEGQSIDNKLLPEKPACFNVYPNPGKDILTVTNVFNDCFYTFCLFDIHGNEVYSSIINSNNFELNTSHLSKGLYFYQITSEAGYLQIGKWIKN